MRIKDPIAEAEEPFNLIPLTDMVFNLLIFFMAATTFAQVEKQLGINLARASAKGQTLSAAPRQMTINVDERGQPVVMQKTMTLAALADEVKARAERSPNLTVIIRADKRGRVEGLDAVLDVCKRAGVNKVEISYLTGGTPAP